MYILFIFYKLNLVVKENDMCRTRHRGDLKIFSIIEKE
jgi:hypothetical protein